MKIVFTKAFSKDLKRLKNKAIKKRVINAIEKIDNASVLSNITSIKKLQGSDNHYRIRIGDYRIGIKEKDDILILMRFLHRKDIYRNFP